MALSNIIFVFFYCGSSGEPSVVICQEVEPLQLEGMWSLDKDREVGGVQPGPGDSLLRRLCAKLQPPGETRKFYLPVKIIRTCHLSFLISY